MSGTFGHFNAHFTHSPKKHKTQSLFSLSLSLSLSQPDSQRLMHAKLIVFVFMVLQLVAMRFGGTMKNMALGFAG